MQKEIKGNYMRLRWIDNLRALLILLVVLGHIIQFTHPTYGDTLPFQYIYSFHMPLFVFVSGFVSSSYQTGWGGVILKRAIQLLVPFLVYSLLLSLIQGCMTRFAELIIYPEKSLWFLWVLFFITLFHQVAIKICSKIRLKEIIGVLAMAVLLFFIGNYAPVFGMPIIAKFFVYYTIAYYSKPLFMNITKDRKNACIALLLLLLYFMFAYWSSYPTPKTMPFTNKTFPFGISKVYQIGVALLAIVAFMMCFIQFADKTVGGITNLGAHDTLGIYGLHTIILNILAIQEITSHFRELSPLGYCSFVVAASVLILVVCVIIIRMTRKSKIISFLLLGENRLISIRKDLN